MAHFDLPLSALETFRPDRDEPADFDAFWADTLAEARGLAWEPRFTPVDPADSGVTGVDVDDVEFAASAGIRSARGSCVRAGSTGPCRASCSTSATTRGAVWRTSTPCCRRRASPSSSWTPAAKAAERCPGPPPIRSDPLRTHAGRLTDGIDDPAHAYYRRVFCDAVLAIDAARAHPAIDGARVSVWGGSQGGGIALAAAALGEGLRFAAIDFPFLSGIRRAVRSPTPPLQRARHLPADQAG